MGNAQGLSFKLKIVKITFIALLLANTPLFASLEKKYRYQAALRSENYLRNVLSFKNYAADISEDKKFDKLLKQFSAKKKSIILRKNDGFVIKKRKSSLINEVIAWELSLIFAVDGIPPAYPLRKFKHLLILQKYENFEINYRINKLDIIETIDLETYWKTNFFIYLLQIADLRSLNIGFSPKKIHLFDTEKLFYRNLNKMNVPFYSATFDMPQFYQPLDQESALELKKWIKSLLTKEAEIYQYCKFRNIENQANKIMARIKRINDFNLADGKSFFDFYAYLNPKIAGGLEELMYIFNYQTGKNFGPGSSLNYLIKEFYRKLSKEKQKQTKTWIGKYCD